MLNNIKPLYLHCVFHGIRFKVNKGWDSAEPLFFYIYLPTVKPSEPIVPSSFLYSFAIFPKHNPNIFLL